VALSVPERYIRLGLQIGQHVERMVDAYFGPEGLAAEVRAGPLTDPSDLVAEADRLLGELRDGWLHDQVIGLRTFATVLNGQLMSFADEVTGFYGVRPERTDLDVFAAAHERLDVLLSGPGSLVERYRSWEDALAVPSDRLEQTLVATIEVARKFTRDLVELPEGEGVIVDNARDVAWMAYCKYGGNLQSRVSVNVDRTLSAVEVLTIATHESYPGHHTERSCKEQLLVRNSQLLEESIVLIPTPQSLISEGIGQVALNVVIQCEGGTALEAVINDAGIEFDLAHALAVERARSDCNWAVVNAALMLDEHTCTPAEAADYLERWGLVRTDIAARLIQFLGNPLSRSYVMTYLAGEALCETYVAGDLARFARLLTHQLALRDLS
jgi:hypothetical protein